MVLVTWDLVLRGYSFGVARETTGKRKPFWGSLLLRSHPHECNLAYR